MKRNLCSLAVLGLLASSCTVAPASSPQTSGLTSIPPTPKTELTSESSNPSETPKVAPTGFEEQVQPTSAMRPTREMPLRFELSRVLAHGSQELIDYFSALGNGFFIPSEGWRQVLIEVAASSSDWQNLPECAFAAEVIVVDTGGFQRPTGGLRVEDFNGLARLLPPGVAQRLWVTADLPNNQDPDRILVDVCGDMVQLEAEHAAAHEFATRYVHPDLPTVPDQVVLEIPGSARLTFNFRETRFIEDDPAFHPGVRYLYVPTTVENIGGYDLAMRSQFPWSDYVSVSGFASTGFIASTFGGPSADFPTIPPGSEHTGDVLLGVAGPGFYPGIDPEDLSVKWIWVQIQFHAGQLPGPFQMIVDSD